VDEHSAIPQASREIALQRLELLRRLLTQMERVLASNGLEVPSVETAPENLVIGQAQGKTGVLHRPNPA
jgi:hypothetical protein